MKGRTPHIEHQANHFSDVRNEMIAIRGDMQIRAWIKAGDRFDGKADGNGLYICYPKNYTVPFWRFRYKLAGKQRAMVIGSYSELSLSKARETAKELSARK